MHTTEVINKTLILPNKKSEFQHCTYLLFNLKLLEPTKEIIINIRRSYCRTNSSSTLSQHFLLRFLSGLWEISLFFSYFALN